MTDVTDRTNTPISTAELERRWSAIRDAMKAAGIDVLVTQNNSEEWGYTRYLTDLPQGGYGSAVIFPVEGPMTVVSHGALADVSIDPGGTPPYRGVGRLLSAPYFPAVHYCQHLDADLVVKGLAPFANGTIGLLGANQIVYPVVSAIREAFSTSDIVDATDIVDAIKVIKSSEEIALIRKTAALQDEGMSLALESLKPGMKDRDVTAMIEGFSGHQGSEYGFYMVGSWNSNDAFPHSWPKHYQERVIQPGDVIGILIENSGPGGYYCELGRTVVLGKAPSRLVDEFAFLVEAQRFNMSLMKPGASCAEIFSLHNDFMRSHSRAAEERIHAHGQGYDLVERPLIRSDEPGTIEPAMNITCHPGTRTADLSCSVCDNFLTGDQEPERLHKTPQQIFELV
jgi:Xaa-Pro aminopeptidase